MLNIPCQVLSNRKGTLLDPKEHSYDLTIPSCVSPTPVLLPGESHGRRSLAGCGPWGCEESDMTERLHFHFSPSCIGEGNGNPIQCSCLENPRDGGAWWAAVYGVAQSRTRLMWLSSSSSSCVSVLSGWVRATVRHLCSDCPIMWLTSHQRHPAF